MTVFHRWLKLPVLYGFDRFFIEAHAQAGLNTNLAGPSIDAHDQRQRADALELCLARFFREFRLGLINHSWRRDSSSDAEDASAGAAAFSRSKARTFAFPYAPTFTLSDAAARSRSIRGQYRMRHGITQVRQIVRRQLHLGRNNDRG